MTGDTLLQAMDHVDPALVTAAEQRPRLWQRKLRRTAATAACFALVFGLGIHTLLRFGYFKAGCSAWPGIIADGSYYFSVSHSGIWRWSEESGTEKLLSVYWYDGSVINDYGIYYCRGRSIYVIPHATGKTEKLYTAPLRGCSHIGFSLLGDGSIDLRVYDKHRKVGSEYLLNGITGAVDEILQQEVPYGDEWYGAYYEKSHFLLGGHLFQLETMADDQATRLTVDGQEYPLPEGAILYPYGTELGDEYVILSGSTLMDGIRMTEDNYSLLLCADGTVWELPAEITFQAGAGGYLYHIEYRDYIDPNFPEELQREACGIRCYEIQTGESWTLTANAALELYEFVTDGDLFFTCVPWREDQVAWRLQYDEAGRPVSLMQLSPNVAPEH